MEDTVAGTGGVVGRAAAYAEALFEGHLRKGTTLPYFTHLEGVAMIVKAHGGTELEVAAGYLHDALEDHPREGKTAAEIGALFGPEILAMIESVSDSTGPGPKAPHDERKAAYAAKMLKANPSTALLAGADKLHNAGCILADYREVGEAVFARFKKGKAGTIAKYRLMANTLCPKVPTALAEKLEKMVAEMEGLA